MASSWFAVYVDTDGQLMEGGSATIAWYGVTIDGASLMTATIGVSVATDTYETHKVEAAEGVWPWCRALAMTPPSVAPKSIDVTLSGTDDGDWSIQVDATTAVTFAASGNATSEIRAGLVAAFAGHPTATAVDVNADTLRVMYSTAGQDFELTLSAPGVGEMTQEEFSPVVAIAETLRIYTAPATPSGIDDAALASVVAGEIVVPTTAEIATAVAAPSASAIANEINAQQACYNAVSQAAQDDVFPIPPTASEIVTAIHGSGYRGRYGGNFGGADTEIQVASVSAGSHIEVLGWVATGTATQQSVELRSGTANASNTSFSPGPADFYVGAGSSVSLPEGDIALWRTNDDEGLVLKKTTLVGLKCVVWYRTVPN